MAWIREKYYKQNVRIGKRVVSTYIGSGLLGAMAARLDHLAQADRHARCVERRRQLARVDYATRPPAALLDHARTVAALVRAAYVASGYHQHKRGEWRKRRMKQIENGTPTKEDITEALRCAMAVDATREQQDALRKALARAPEAGRMLDLAEKAINAMVGAMPADPVWRVVQFGRMEALRAELSGDAPTVLERLLIDQVILSYIHLNLIEYQQARLWEKEMSMEVVEFWERRLDGAQRRYHRAIKVLADVRRLLKTPGPQFNINLPGGRQVNISGDNSPA